MNIKLPSSSVHSTHVYICALHCTCSHHALFRRLLTMHVTESLTLRAGPLNPRTFSMAVVLPTGDVLHFGGNGISEQFSDDDALLQPGACTPQHETWPTIVLF